MGASALQGESHPPGRHRHLLGAPCSLSRRCVGLLVAMALTTLLRDPQSGLRRWFERRLPNLQPMKLAWRAAGPPSVPCSGSAIRSTVGTAFDYRLRYLFGETPAREFVAAHVGRGWAWWAKFSVELDSAVERLSPVNRRLDPLEEAELDRYCWVLALLESRYRMKGRFSNPRDGLGPAVDPEELLALAPSAGLNDLAGLVEMLHGSILARMVGRPQVLNPRFEGSRLLKADGDLIVEGILIDAKTTIDRNMDKTAAYQLLGYFLLDFHDTYKIDRVAFYLSRIPKLVMWRVDELLELVADEPVDVAELRTEFESVCRRSLSQA